MTHPIGSLPSNSSGTDTSGNTGSSEPKDYSIFNKPLNGNYLIVPQDAPLDERPAISTSGDRYTFLLTTKETNFGLNAFDFFVPTGGGPPPHIHNFEHEAFFVEEGTVNFFVGNEAGALDIASGDPGKEEFILEGLPEGTFVFGPRLRPHGFANPNSTAATSGTSTGARVLSVTTPGGLDLLFEFAGIPVIDRNDPIPAPPLGIDPKQLEFGQRTGGGVAFNGYQPPQGTPNYVLVLPDNATQELKDTIQTQLAGVDGFTISTYSERPKFTGLFGIEYTSLSSFAETVDDQGNKLAYNSFSLAPTNTDTFAQAYLNANQVLVPTQSSGTGIADLKINAQGEIEYSLTVTGLDFGALVVGGTPQTANTDDDVTAIHIHTGERGSSGVHVFNILDGNEQDETDLSISLNDGIATISGIWNQTEKAIPSALSDFLNNPGLPGNESDFYIQVHTEGNPSGEIRGQIASSTNDFPEMIHSDNHEAFYVREGTLSFKIDNEVRLVEADTFVYVQPGTKYSFANFGNEEVTSLAVSVDSPPVLPAVIPSTLTAQSSVLSNDFKFLSGNDNVFGDTTGSRRRIYGSEGNDEIFVNEDDRAFGKSGDDIIDASQGQGGNRLYGGDGNDEIYVNTNDRAFGEDGDDIIDASGDGGYNRLDGGNGHDTLFAGRYDELFGEEGNDILIIGTGGNNLLYGGAGEDRFVIADSGFAESVVETRQLTQFGLPQLTDTKNMIMDFQLGVDKIVINNIAHINSFDDLTLLPAFGDIRSTSILARVNAPGSTDNSEISLATISNVVFNELTASDFIFG
ncbi:CHRD domain-containing protein [Anabaena sp. UHCC 0451]|uniref:CHRD domain-containing protein n=1 Tax=Anabaena sp. UHCC 0451 TaxID=2055235 RepID=UPI002B1F8613|nr:CHRD domain-containing protein [Anabaena sp. UHCC 0451]MEA5574987.1 CHRD domain-containing protein [Anabaena sp. UHCC 0451]